MVEGKKQFLSKGIDNEGKFLLTTSYHLEIMKKKGCFMHKLGLCFPDDEGCHKEFRITPPIGDLYGKNSV